jgi:hypothetical protein
MEKRKKGKYLESKKTNENVKFKVDFLKSTKQSYEMQNSNYTTTFIFKDGTRHKFIKSEMDIETFIAFNKVKKDIDVLNIDYDFILEDFKLTESNVYFNSMPSIKSFKSDEILNIDLKGAYPTTIFNLGFITEETKDFVFDLPKKSRLACLGMLASKKVHTFFVDGEPQRFDISKSKYRPIFILLVRYVDKVMLEISKIAGEDFIFFWVDGIYLRKTISDWKLFLIKDYLKDLKFDYHEDILKNFKLKRKGKMLKIKFEKENKIKKFKFRDKSIITQTNNFINLLNRKTVENQKIKKQENEHN